MTVGGCWYQLLGAKDKTNMNPFLDGQLPHCLEPMRQHGCLFIIAARHTLHAPPRISHRQGDCRARPNKHRHGTAVKCINIGDVEDYAPPPGPAPLGRLGNEVKIAHPYSKAGEGRLFVAMQDLKPQPAVKSDSSWHFVGAQCDGADPLDHGQSSPVLFPRAVGVATLTVSLFGVKSLTFSRRKVVQAGNLTSPAVY